MHDIKFSYWSQIENNAIICFSSLTCNRLSKIRKTNDVLGRIIQLTRNWKLEMNRCINRIVNCCNFTNFLEALKSKFKKQNYSEVTDASQVVSPRFLLKIIIWENAVYWHTSVYSFSPMKGYISFCTWSGCCYELCVCFRHYFRSCFKILFFVVETINNLF